MARGRVTLRYMLTKLAGATEEFFAELSSSSSAAATAASTSSRGAAVAATAASSAAAGAANAPPPGTLAAALSRFQDSYRAASTMRVLLAGAAMAPALNPAAAAGDPRALEALVVRLLPRPSPRSVSVGDVVAFRAPPAVAGAAAEGGSGDNDNASLSSTTTEVLVRRVAALEQAEMVSDESGDEPFRVPAGHCWLLADNAVGAVAASASAADADNADDDSSPSSSSSTPTPPLDSRSFGFVPMTSVLGRVVYSLRSAGEHGHVANAPSSAAGDAAVAEAEVDVDQLARMVRAARERWDDAVQEEQEAAATRREEPQGQQPRAQQAAEQQAGAADERGGGSGA